MLSINGAFRPQRVSGQQRFAAEIAHRLLNEPDVGEIDLPPSLARHAVTSWSWVQTGLPVTARGNVLISLTSRAPALANRHVVTIHDLFPITNPQWYSRRFVAVHGPLLRHQLRHAAVVVTVSEPVAEQIRERTGGRCDPIVVPNAPSRVFSEPVTLDGARAALTRVGRGDVLQRAGYFLCVGSMDPRKNLARLVRAHGYLPRSAQEDFPLVVVGGEWSLFRGGAVESSRSVVRTGYVSDKELAALYRGARAVVFPSLDEGFGLPAVEAAAAGARLILSDIPVFRWVCGDDAQYFDPEDEESITTSLAQDVSASRSGEASQHLEETVGARFSWESSAKILLNSVRARYDPA